MEFYDQLEQILSSMPRLNLEQSGKVRLMDRVDRKYLANKKLLLQYLNMVKDSYYLLVAGDSPVASYATTYWDTADHRFYTMHHNGARPRVKVRVRTYVDTATSFLEVKNKDNHSMTSKSRVRLANPEDVNSDDEEFLEDKADVRLDEIHPCLTNSFHRVTLVSRKMNERITLDFDLKFHNIETNTDTSLGSLVIMEVKSSGKRSSDSIDVLRELRIKASGFSKYCIGTYLTNPDVKHNKFKKNMIEISRLEI